MTNDHFIDKLAAFSFFCRPTSFLEMRKVSTSDLPSIQTENDGEEHRRHFQQEHFFDRQEVPLGRKTMQNVKTAGSHEFIYLPYEVASALGSISRSIQGKIDRSCSGNDPDLGVLGVKRSEDTVHRGGVVDRYWSKKTHFPALAQGTGGITTKNVSLCSRER